MFIENVLETAKQIPRVKDDPETFRQFVGLAGAYSKTNRELAGIGEGKLEEDPKFFLYTLLTSNNLTKAADEFESFLRRANAFTDYEDGLIFETSQDGGFIAYDLISNETENELRDGQIVRYATEKDGEKNFYASLQVLRAGEPRDKPLEEREIYTGDQVFRFYSSREVQETLQDNENTRLQPGEVAIYLGDTIQVERGTTTVLEPLEGAAILERARRIVEAFGLVDRAAIGKGVELWDAINENKWLTGALLGTFAGLQFTPVGPILDAALVLVGGFAAGFSFTSFLIEAGTAERQADLYEAAGHFVDFLAALTDIATSSALLRFTNSENAISLVDDFVDVFRSLRNLSENVWSIQDDLTNGSKISQALSLVFDRFIETDSALGRLKQFADTQMIDYLRTSINEGIVLNDNPNNLDLNWLATFGDRWERVNEVASLRDSLDGDKVTRWLDEYSFLYGDILKFDAAENETLINILRSATPPVSFTPENLVRIEAPERPIKVLPQDKRTSTNPDDLVELTFPVFLEIGNNTRPPDVTNSGQDTGVGLVHIIGKHANDFATRNIPEDKIIDAVFAALQRGENVGYQIRPGRQVYKVNLEAELGLPGLTEEYIAITVGSNGFVVGANPVRSSDITFY